MASWLAIHWRMLGDDMSAMPIPPAKPGQNSRRLGFLVYLLLFTEA